MSKSKVKATVGSFSGAAVMGKGRLQGLTSEEAMAMYFKLREEQGIAEIVGHNRECFFCGKTEDEVKRRGDILRIAASQSAGQALDICNTCAPGYIVTLMRSLPKIDAYVAAGEIGEMFGFRNLYRPEYDFETRRASGDWSSFMKRMTDKTRRRRELMSGSLFSDALLKSLLDDLIKDGHASVNIPV